MKTIEVNIKLDPINDGAIINPNRIVRKVEGALVLATNGESKIISEDEAVEILDLLSGNTQGEYMGKTPYLAVFNGEKIFKIGSKHFFIGSALIVKNTKDGITMLADEDFEKATEEFESRLITLVGDGQEFSAYELAE
ncbi:MAG: hypothetical protein IKO32_00720 [Lachnospiraceae bacterium]|nr:hypothetical protein [Lachnospiraceae bacterium]